MYEYTRLARRAPRTIRADRLHPEMEELVPYARGAEVAACWRPTMSAHAIVLLE